LLSAVALSLFWAPQRAAAQAAPLPVQKLVARPGDLPGLAGAQSYLTSTSSPFEWAHGQQGGTWTEAQEEATTLQTLGFEEAVRRAFLARTSEAHGKHREAVSEAVVLPSATNAQAAMVASAATFVKQSTKPSLFEFGDRAIPNAMVLGNLTPGRRGGDGNVLFTSGRCYFVIGDYLYAARSRAQVDRAPLAAALALYRRERVLCA
jgi:hypothetical protein